MYYSDHFSLGRGGRLEIVMSFALLKKSSYFKFVSVHSSFISVPIIKTIFQILQFSFFVSVLSEIYFKSEAVIRAV